MMDQCGRCHEEEAETFFDTFHGKVSRLGSAGAAKCYDCHGTHNILPTSDPDSTLGRDNVVETCGQCHEGSHRRFAGYLTHATHHDPESYPWLFWSFWFMTTLLVGTLTFAMLHTLAWLVRLYLSATSGRPTRRWPSRPQAALPALHALQPASAPRHADQLLHPGADRHGAEVLLHGLGPGLRRLLGGFAVTGALHRIGAVVLFVVFVSTSGTSSTTKRTEE